MSWPAGCAKSAKTSRPPTTWSATPPPGQTHDRDPAWLLTGTRLADAETLSAQQVFSDRLAGTRDYLTACRDAEDAKLAAEEEQRQAELRHAQERQQTAEAHAATLRRRSRVLAVIAVIAVVGAVVAVIAFAPRLPFKPRQRTVAKHQEATAPPR